MQTYLFYDLETSGISPVFDQVYQFAAIRTDLHLNEIERYEFLVKPTIDIIPDPGASIVHRLSMQKLIAEGEAENTVIFKIHQLLNTPGTISLGYNTLNFDDEFLRFNFYRHLLTPYTHQFANHCRRMDLFPMVVFYYLGRRDHLEWGLRDDKVSLKLELLSEKNKLADGPAHNAMVDVEATVALAKRLREDSKLWESLLGCFIKNEDLQRLSKLPLVEINGVGYPTGIAVSGKFGSAKSYQVPVLGLGQHWHYANQTIWLNLDDERILSGDEALISQLWTTKKRAAEPPFIMQAKGGFYQLDADRKQLAAETIRFLQETPQYFRAIQDYALDFKFPVYPETDIDAALYQNKFWTDEDVFAMRQFWQSPLSEKANVYFKRSELRALSQRFLARFYGQETPEFADYLRRIWHNESSGVMDYQLQSKRTCFQALAKALEIGQICLDEEQKQVLQGVEGYLNATRKIHQQ